MHRSYRFVVAGLILATAAVAALAAQAGPAASPWTRISGPTQPGVQLGLARTADGVLHVIWNRGTSPTSIFETRYSPAGRAVGTSTVARGYNGNGGVALLVMPDRTLRLFAAGATSPSSPAYGINTFTAPASGRTWSLQSGVSWGGSVAGASGVIGAALTKDGQPVTAWRGFAAEGLPPGSLPQNPFVGDQTASHLATDAASGAVVLSGPTIAGKGGIFVRQILPDAGAAVTLPMPFGTKDWYMGLSGRIGAPGVYVAYTDSKAVRLYRYRGRSQALARGTYTTATVCAGPGGRLWVAWGDGGTDVLFVTRSNRAAGAFEPVQKLTLPQNTTNGLTFMQCEGSAGPLDLFADVTDKALRPGFWHTHVLAQLSLRVSVAKTKNGTKVRISARDAGDPVGGATIAVGGKHLKTDAKGQATLTLRPGSYTASATGAGYAPASSRFRA
jgi:hypothetical protein